MCPLLATDPAGPAPSGPEEPSALERLLEAMSRHLPETDEVGEQLLRRTLAWLTPGAGAASGRASAAALDLGFAVARALADLRLDPAALAATLLVAGLPPKAVAAPELAQTFGA